MKKEEKRTTNKKFIIIAILTLVALALFGFIFYKVLSGDKKITNVEKSIVLDA